MKKIDFGQTITVLANVGVIAGIAFLAIEIRQNTQSIALGAYQDLMSQISQINALGVENPRVTAWLVENSDKSIPVSDRDEDFYAARSVVFLMIRHGDMAFHHLEQGAITPARFDSAIGPLRDNICSLFWQEAWDFGRDNYVTEYQELIDGYVRDCE